MEKVIFSIHPPYAHLKSTSRPPYIHLTSTLGNSRSHSPYWLCLSLAWDMYKAWEYVREIPTFCQRDCFFPNGTRYTLTEPLPSPSPSPLSSSSPSPSLSPSPSPSLSPSYSQQECALSNCQTEIQLWEVETDVYLWWGVVCLVFVDIACHVSVLGGAVMDQWRDLSQLRSRIVTRMESLISASPFSGISTAHFPTHILVSFACSLFLGSVVSAATLSVTLSSLTPLVRFLTVLRDYIPEIEPDLISLGLSNPNLEDEISQDATVAEAWLNFLIDLVSSIEITIVTSISICWVVFFISNFYSLFAFRRDFLKKARESPPLRMDISNSACFIGGYISNCICALIFSWVVVALFLFLFVNRFLRRHVVYNYQLWLILIASPLIAYLIRVFFLEYDYGKPSRGIIHPKRYRAAYAFVTLTSIVAGPTYGIARILTALAFLLVMIHRVDWSLIPPPFEHWDGVYTSYVNLINLEQLNGGQREEREREREREKAEVGEMEG